METGSPAYISGVAPNEDEKLWGMLAHLLMLVLIGPILVLLTKGKESSFVRANAVEALNFQITLFIFNIAVTILSMVLGAIVGFLGTVLGCLSPLVGLAALVFVIIASMKAKDGGLYQYPVNLRLVK